MSRGREGLRLIVFPVRNDHACGLSADERAVRWDVTDSSTMVEPPQREQFVDLAACHARIRSITPEGPVGRWGDSARTRRTASHQRN